MNSRLKAPARGKTLSAPILISVYVVCAVIIGLCIWQASSSPGSRIFYYCLAAAALGYGVFITFANEKNKKTSRKR